MWVFATIVTGIVLLDKTVFAVGDLYNQNNIMRYSRLYPLYIPVTIKTFMSKKFGFKVDREQSLKFLGNPASSLHYPLQPLVFNRLSHYPNIVIIAVESWRSDMFNQETTPHLFNFSAQCLTGLNHYSGGNASRFGIFSIFYGLYGTYWHQILAERRSPVLIDQLLELHYQIRVSSSTKLTYPEFRKTIFVRIPESIEDELPGPSALERDSLQVENFLNWVNHRDPLRPFFSFLFFDAPHSPFAYPPEFDKFQPSAGNIDYLTIDEHNLLPLYNRYRNAILYDDYLIGKLLAGLDKQKLLDSTIIIVTGDHGEEFNESGFFGHTSAFSEQQVKVAFLLHLPGSTPQSLTHLTSHLDIAPTLLGLLGCTNLSSDFSHGQSLFENRPFVVTAGWDDCAIIDSTHFVVFSVESYNAAKSEIRDHQYRLVNNSKEIIQSKMPYLLDYCKNFKRFIR